MPYTVRAERDEQCRSATRVQPASAVVLALKWAEEGYQVVRIIGENGRSLDIRTAQERLARGLRL